MNYQPPAFRDRLAAVVREPVTVAIIVAVAVTGVLIVAVVATWSVAPVGSAPTPTPVPVPAAAMLTPTPRTIEIRRSTPAPAPPTATAPPAATATQAARPRINLAPPTPTPRPRPTPTSTPELEPEPELVFEAAKASELSTMATEGWTVNEDQLVFDDASAVAAPWLVTPRSPPRGDYAIEADLRVRGLAEGVCNQNFGVVAGTEANGIVWGGGVIYECGSRSPRARLTDVTNWRDGYDQDRQLVGKNFEPDREWHTYRLEVRGNDLRLLIDGEQVLKAQDDRATQPPDSAAQQAGVWTQGVRLVIRRIAIYRLD